MKIGKPSFISALTIVCLSSVTGILYNYFNPSGLALIKKETPVRWASDSLLSAESSVTASDSAETMNSTAPDTANPVAGKLLGADSKNTDSKDTDSKDRASKDTDSKNLNSKTPDPRDKTPAKTGPSGSSESIISSDDGKPDANDAGEAKSAAAITLKQALRLYSTRNTVFIDARDKWDYADGHIKGAINIPGYNIENNLSKIHGLDKKRIYVTYCSESDCHLSQKLAEELRRLGFSKVYYFKEGYEAWNRAGHPTESTETE